MPHDALPRILYLSDNNPETEHLVIQLEQAGYQVDITETHRSANGTTKELYELVIIDQPTVKLEKFLATSENLSATIIMIEQGHEHLAVKAMKSGVGDYLVKDPAGAYQELFPLLVEKVLAHKRLLANQQAMYNAAQERNNVLTLLNEISNEISSTLDTNEVLERLMSATLTVMGAQGCSIWLWEDEQKENLVCRALADQVVSPPLLGVKVRYDQGVVGWVAENNRSAIVQQTAEDVRFLAEIDVKINFQTQSLMAMPIRIGDEVIGVLEIVNKLEGEFNSDDVSVARALAASAATAIENARLVGALRSRTAALEEHNAELDAFAHTVAHDIQNMLARIVGFAELLKMDLSSPDSGVPFEEMSKSAAYISNNSRKMSKVVDALLLLAAVRQTEVKLEPLSMGKIVDEVLERVSDTIQEKETSLTVTKEWPTAYGYAPWVEEVWYNYINNALKYGGDPLKITIGATKMINGTEVQFWVKDQGPGISPEQQKVLFAPFTQLSTKRKKGHGLGLSIVERIIKKMGGHVGVESAVGEGSKFYFTLPVTIQDKDLLLNQ
ncbi:MAG: GAF domain-containing protein [Anaerolineales bacterium]|nr:GAF domain-containing protein [Anaerolineales bacterium]